MVSGVLWHQSGFICSAKCLVRCWIPAPRTPTSEALHKKRPRTRPNPRTVDPTASCKPNPKTLPAKPLGRSFS